MHNILRSEQDHQSERIPVGEAIMSAAELQNLSTASDIVAVGSDTLEFSHGGAPDKSPRAANQQEEDTIQRSYSLANKPMQKMIVSKEVPSKPKPAAAKTGVNPESVEENDQTKQASTSANLTGHHSLMSINQHSRLIRGGGLLKKINGGDQEEESDQHKKTIFSESRKSIVKEGASARTLQQALGVHHKDKPLKRVTEDVAREITEGRIKVVSERPQWQCNGPRR